MRMGVVIMAWPPTIKVAMFNLLLTGEHISADIHTSNILNYHSFVVCAFAY
jgi:hypothetical protein